MIHFLKRRGWIGVLVGLALLLLPNELWRSLALLEGGLPTPTPQPTRDARDDVFRQGLTLAASDPLAALPFLEEIMFTEHPAAGQARTVALAIQSARLSDDPAFLFTASGRALAAVGEWRLARDALLQAVQHAPDYAEAWAYLGEAQYQNGEHGYPALKQALELNPNSMSAQLFNALYWQRQSDFEQANLHFFIAAGLEPGNPAIYIQWGKSAMLAGELIEARELFERAAELTPDDPTVWKALAEYSIESELYVEELGVPAASRLVTADPTDVEAMTLLGRAYVLLGKGVTGRVFLERAVELDPNYALGHYYLAIFLIAEGEIEQALIDLNRVIALSPGSPEAVQASGLIIQYRR
ncbi:MAG: tetratricopeptide repeat protein [Anaerolineales bacterium]